MYGESVVKEIKGIIPTNRRASDDFAVLEELDVASYIGQITVCREGDVALFRNGEGSIVELVRIGIKTLRVDRKPKEGAGNDGPIGIINDAALFEREAANIDDCRQMNVIFEEMIVLVLTPAIHH